MSILSIADRFMMEEVKKDALKSLQMISALIKSVDKIIAGYKFLPQWVREGYKELIIRDEPLTPDEGSILGLKHSLLCAAAREQYIRDKPYDIALFMFFQATWLIIWSISIRSLPTVQLRLFSPPFPEKTVLKDTTYRKAFLS